MKKSRSKFFASLSAIYVLVAALNMPVCALPFGKQASQAAAIKAALKAKEAIPVIHDKWAVIVGSGDYKDPALNSLLFGARAADSFSNALIDTAAGKFQPDHVITLTRSHATKNAINAALSESWLLSKALPTDLIVVYFCTRAVPTSDGKALVLCTYDTLASSVEQSGLLLHDLLSDLRRRSQCKNIVCFLDLQPMSGLVSPPTNLLFPVASANSSTITRTAAVAGNNGSPLARLSQVSDVTLVSANSLLAPSYESQSKRNTYFAHYLSEGVKQNGGLQPLNDLTQYVGENVVNDVRNELHLEQLVETRIASENPHLASVALGVPVNGGKAPIPAANVRFGYEYDRLGIERPDMLPNAPPVVKSAPSVHGMLVGTGLAQQAAASAAAHPVDAQRDDDDDDNDWVDGKKVDMASYLSRIKSQIQSKWTPPKGLEQKKVGVVFSIVKDGTIKDAEVIEASGESSVDQSALDALKAASPLQPLPMGAPKHVRVSYKFQWKVGHH